MRKWAFNTKMDIGYILVGNDAGEDRVDSVPQRRIVRVRDGVALLEYNRHVKMLDKGVIGRVSNKKRDLAGELAFIPKRVPFKWQRGNKIGKTLNLVKFCMKWIMD